MKSPYEIIEKPLVTEKSVDSAAAGKYTFRVSKDANKVEIAHAVEAIFSVKVDKVNTVTVRGKTRRVGRHPEGRKPDWKKAIVTLKSGQTLDIFEGM
ncbi:MAG: 50S ribosomal protein L23 [Armatimonadetes bacterium]|nr:50S ribosomal protein L23 [Armatimonadota bacterium]